MKLGKIKVSSTLVLESTKDLIPLFTKFVPLHIEREMNIGDFIYTGFCEEFEDIKEGEDAPFYECKMTSLDYGNEILVELKKTGIIIPRVPKEQRETIIHN